MSVLATLPPLRTWSIDHGYISVDHYTKGEVKELEDAEPPFPFMSEKVVHMKVNSGSKIRNLMGFAVKKMKEADIDQLTWNGSGTAVTKTITCAEIMKRKIKDLHQVNSIHYKRTEEYWDPKEEGLDRLKVNRDVPCISILLSKTPLSEALPGYQAPGSFDAFWKTVVEKDVKSSNQRRKQKQQSSSKTAMDPSKIEVKNNKKLKKEERGSINAKDSRSKNQRKQKTVQDVGCKTTVTESKSNKDLVQPASSAGGDTSERKDYKRTGIDGETAHEGSLVDK